MNSPQSQFQKPSSIILLSLVSAGVVILLLALSISQIQLDEGYTIPVADAEMQNMPLEQVLSGGEIWEIILRGLMALCLIALPIYVIQSLFSKKGRQRLLADIIIIGAVFLLMQCADNQDLEEEMVYEEMEMEIGSSNPFDMEVSTISTEPLPEMPEEAPPWINTLVAILLVLFIVAIVVTAYIIIQRRRKPKDQDALDRVADQAQEALHKIRSGGDFNSAILNCYYEMNRIVKEEMRISRQRQMTARDFELYLVEKGLPEAPLTQLTQLFERARYSNQSPDQTQEQTAISALTSLIEKVREMAVKEEEEV